MLILKPEREADDLDARPEPGADGELVVLADPARPGDGGRSLSMGYIALADACEQADR